MPLPRHGWFRIAESHPKLHFPRPA
jgi:hypothetical protein